MKVIFDSAVQLEYPTLQDLNVDVVEYPLYVNGDPYRVSIDMTREAKDELRRLLKEKENVVTTSGLRSQDLLEVYQKNSPGKIISIHQAGKASTATSQAIKAILSENPDLDIEFVDSHHLTSAYSVIAQQVAEAVNEGMPYDQLMDYIPRIRGNTRHLGAVFDLFYLARTGRIGYAKALLGSAMKIIALLSSSEEPGMLKSMGKAKNYQQVNQRFLQVIREDFENKKGKRIRAVISIIGPHEREAKDLKERLDKLEFPVESQIHYSNHSNMPHAGPDFYDIGYTIHE